ncbi:MAG: SMP-30/gluconolactonase/LRE family protein, partial [Gammaproteobacteria bacterium]
MRGLKIRYGPIFAVAVMFVALVAPAAPAEFKAWVFATFEDTPEGLAVDAAGNIYAALFHTGKIVKLTPDGKKEVIAVVPSEKDATKGDTVG